ncbi:MAG: right-handed parallel beta-helix repeat-containing protein [Anaerolineae bacterium]|nr:right-handed parallel beta-helix repeat-containing protein [Anaerolineae bacterium]NUQ04592.1 right-handed parallel beta-helix repeat-containing protein [Anaerolineae bacterium]
MTALYRSLAPIVALVAAALCLLLTFDVQAQQPAYTPYDIGSPTLVDLYVSPTGDDAAGDGSAAAPFRTLTAAWERIPREQPLEQTGYRIRLMPGTYTAEEAPNYWESRYGTPEHPILIQAMNGRDTVILPHVNVFDSRYLYFIDLTFAPGTDAFHCERCDHLLLRGSRFVGADPESYDAQETVKVNQSQHVFIEDSDISGAWNNAVDFVAVQHGHVITSRIHNAGDWCMYAKGGSADLLIAGNTVYDCGTGGVSAGEGTGFQYMVEPWLQYEAYDLRILDNVIHDTAGAGIGVQGGTRILIAGNILYRAGERSHMVEFVFGLRSCDGQPGDEGRERCDAYAAAGGWGDSAIADGDNAIRIPNRSVYFYNNILYNPPGYQSAYSHFTIFAPRTGEAQMNAGVPVPTRADEDLRIRGNVIWNGGADMPLGVETSPDFPAGCPPDNPACSAAQLRADNAINTVEPRLVDPEGGDYRPAPGWRFTTYAIPEFPA